MADGSMTNFPQLDSSPGLWLIRTLYEWRVIQELISSGRADWTFQGKLPRTRLLDTITDLAVQGTQS